MNVLEAIDSRIETARGTPRPVVPFPIDLDKELIRNHARKLAAELAWIPSIQKSHVLTECASALALDLHQLSSSTSRANKTFRDSAPVVKSNLYAVTETFR